MRPEKTLGLELHAVDNLLNRSLNATIARNDAEDITPVHGMILGFLHSEQERELYQRDIEAEFCITRSTVTNILKLMEKKGYILRESVPHDARLKRIRLTEQGEESFQRIDSSIKQTEKRMKQALTPAEYDQLMTLLDRVKTAIS